MKTEETQCCLPTFLIGSAFVKPLVWCFMRKVVMTSRCAKLAAYYTCKAGAAVICCTIFMKTTAIQRKWQGKKGHGFMILEGKKAFFKVLQTETEMWMNETAHTLVTEDISMLWMCEIWRLIAEGSTGWKYRELQGRTVWVGWLAPSATHRSHHLNQFHLSWDTSRQIQSIFCQCFTMLVKGTIFTVDRMRTSANAYIVE